jgi:nucleoside-diphosphate-sugar epimerase
MRASIPIARFVNPLMGFPPNMREMISAGHDVTYWARCDKAMNELGYSPRSLEQGLKDMLEAEGYVSP